MYAYQQRVAGTLWVEAGRAALWLEETAGPVYLRFALLALDLERQIVPAVVLDDWGKEIRGQEMFGWLRENGPYFPRAEVFGFDLQGRPQQYFLKELELTARYSCYAAADPAAPLAAGAPLEAVLLPDDQVTGIARTRRPAGITLPLRHAQLTWWQVNPALKPTFSLALLRSNED
ncbi:MAG: hypothetical protein L0332_04615 [Chloroflexi bacterium]|nr:hypothetical protein [Chloroflexota bacterium]MCI0577332.1 hypothetical protein [Chloroflexota bacterium]MCI0648132.1 hypothetical protein [Chloroflexota bacterium]MCI0725990.1 hypothetical protein [Chloroflexota bacterium]